MIKKTLTAVIITLFYITANSQEINAIVIRQGDDDNKSHYQLALTPKFAIDGVSVKVLVDETEKDQFDISTNELNILFSTVFDGETEIENITGDHPVIIEDNSILTVTGTITNTDPTNLIIKDGGQLIFDNSNIKATVEKNIIPYSSEDYGVVGWHFIASPITDFAVASFVNQANDDSFDLYKWYVGNNGIPMWYNYKAHYTQDYDEEAGTGFETNFLCGRGYLVAYETNNLLKMQGTLNTGTTFNFPIYGKNNFTLLGNPFSYDLNWNEFNNKTGIYDGFALIDSKEGTIEYVIGNTPIKVGTGFMVYAESDNAELSFTKGGENKNSKSNEILALNLFASNESGEDNTIIVLADRNGGFAKADNFNTNVPQIYTERLKTKYGIRNFSTSTKEFNVSFKAASEGYNTIRLETIGEFDNVHLYDKLTDVDVDMLLEGSYTFEASKDDDTHRFIVTINRDYTGIDENVNENFVSINNGEIHISGSGEVQILDVMGRMVHSEVISGDATISTSNMNDGVYVVRLVGDGLTKVEKIVVRR